jgi:hypothetical protein
VRLICQIARRSCVLSPMRSGASHVVRVGIDGVDGAGKSLFGNELAQTAYAAYDMSAPEKPAQRVTEDGCASEFCRKCALLG